MPAIIPGSSVSVQFSKNYGCDCGIVPICGMNIDENDEEFRIEYYFPYFSGSGISSQEM